MDTLNAATLEYAKTRQQFGVPIARFRALQHRMVEMFIHAEQSRSITLLAAARFEESSPEERRRFASAAKARVGRPRARSAEAVQIHGGMGVTNELPAAHMFKRLTLINTTFGDVDHHRAASPHSRASSRQPDARPRAVSRQAAPVVRARLLLPGTSPAVVPA